MTKSELGASVPKVEIVRMGFLRPGDVLVVTMRDSVYLSQEDKHRIASLFPSYVKLVFLTNASIEIVRPVDGGETTEADEVEGVGGESGEAEA